MMENYRRLYELECTVCLDEHYPTNRSGMRLRVDARDLPGGLRIRCPDCDDVTIHRFPPIADLEGERVLAHCVGCFEWTGTGDTCRSCGALAKAEQEGKV